MKEKIIQLLISLGILPDEKKEEVSQALDGVIATDSKPDTPPINTEKLSPELKAVVEGLQVQIATLNQQNKTLLSTLNKERDEREKIIKAQQDQAKTQHESKVKDAVDKAIKDGLFPEAKRDSLTKTASADLDNFQALISDMKPDKRFEKPPADKKEPEVRQLNPLESGNPDILSSVKKYANINE